MALKPITLDQASDQERQLLDKVKAKHGFVPNILAVMASAPPLLDAYMSLSSLFDKTSLTPTERQVVLLAISAQNDCRYCVAAHSVMAGMQKVDSAVVDAIRAGRPIEDQKLEALRKFAEETAVSRGRPDQSVREAFFAAGYTEAHVLEVILGVGMKTLSNYTNHVAETPLDEVFAKGAWTPEVSG